MMKRHTFSLDDFQNFARQNGGSSPPREGRPVEHSLTPGQGDPASPFPAEPARVANLSDLGLSDDKPDALTAAIVSCTPPSNRPEMWKAPGVPDRSAVVFFVACELHRRGVAPDKIAGALLNPDWAISDHAREQKHHEQYALRQAQRAAEAEGEATAEKVNNVIPPSDPSGALVWMNHRHAVIEVDGANCLVASWVPSDLAQGRTEIKMQSFTALQQRYANRRVENKDADGNTKLARLGHWWLDQAARRQFLNIVFRPGEAPVIGRSYNLWQGFGVEPKAGDWSRMRDHVRMVLAGGDPDVDEYIRRWAAYAVQSLAGPQGVVLAFRGAKGSGKGTFARALTDLFGQHGLHVASSSLLTGRFTGHLEDCCLLFADEAISPGDKEAESRLKALTTEPTLALEAKGRDARAAANHLKIVMASNNEWIAPASWDERRYAVFDVSPERIGDKPYFDALNAELKAGGMAAMLHDLLALDLGDWKPWDTIPKTEALAHQKDLSLPPDEAWLLGVLEAGEIPGERPQGFGPYCRPSKWALGREGGVIEDMRRSSRALGQLTDQKLGGFLRHWLIKYTTGSTRGWRFPPLADLRAKWEAKHGQRVWPDGVDEWPVEAFAQEVNRDLPF